MTYRYSNESERADEGIYDDVKLKQPFRLHGLYKNMSELQGLSQRSHIVVKKASCNSSPHDIHDIVDVIRQP